MDKLFLAILNMSLTGAFVIAAICVARLPLKKAPKSISYCLWAVAGFRLVFPFSVESVFSLIPFKAQTIPPDIAMQPIPRIDSGIPFVNNAVSSILPAAETAASVNPLQIWTAIGAWFWIVGVAVMLIYGNISFLILKRKMNEAAHTEANIYEAENIKTPFVLGIFRPKIFLPIGLSEQEISYIILHEKTHIKRHDHIVKFAAYFVLCLHWFNPLAWVAFLLMGVDMEMSCDERVLKEAGGETKKDYSLTLLSLATERRIIGGSPLAFGEGGIKERVKNVLNFKKTSRVIIVAAIALVAVLSVGFAMNKIVNAPLIEMKIVYEENPAFFFKDMKLLWGDTVYHETPMNNAGQGKEIGYANDEYSTWRIFELKGYSRDYLLTVESEGAWRIMSNRPPDEPLRQYILENATDRDKGSRLLSVSLYHDGTARLATPPISSYAMVGTVYYSFEKDELLIGYKNKNIVESSRLEPFAVFDVADDNTIVFKSATVPLFADEGARYTDFTVPLIEPVETIPLNKSPLEVAVSQAIIANNNYDYLGDVYQTEAHTTLHIDDNDNIVTVYAMAYSAAYSYNKSKLHLSGGNHMPIAITFEKDNQGEYTLVEYWNPQDGSLYLSSIQAKFPRSIWGKIDTQLYVANHSLTALRSAQDYIGLADLTPPEIVILKPLIIEKGIKPDWSDYISIVDDVDGNIDISEAYIWDVMIEFDKPGKYPLQIIIQDNAGNENRSLDNEVMIK
ncbi:MAG: hypothetical protein FWH01_04270 [Oscillospiraceae bacterium]|nr:hypothetical protein [Oscillospiraceae bacterium]